MALQEQYVELPLNAGVDETANKEGNVKGLLGLVNGEYDDTESVRPRLGVEHIGTPSGYAGHALVSTPSSVGVLTDGGVQAYVPGAGMQVQAAVSSMQATALGTSWNGRRVLSSDSSTLKGFTFIAICELLEGSADVVNSGTAARRISWRVVDNATWTTVDSGTLFGTVTGAFYPRVVKMDANNFGLFWEEGTIALAGGTTLNYFTWNTTTRTAAATVTASTLTSTDSDRMGFDACDGGYFAFIHTAGNIKVGLAGLTSVTTLFNDTASTTTVGAIAICADTGRVVVGYQGAGGITASEYPLALSSRLSNAVVFAFGGGSSYYALGVCGIQVGFTVRFVVEDFGNLQTKFASFTSGTITLPASRARTRPVTKPWNPGAVNVSVCGLSPTNAYLTQTRTIVVVDTVSNNPWAQIATDEQGLLLKGTPLIGIAGGGTSGPYTLSVPVTEETGDAASAGGVSPPTGLESCRVRTVQLDLGAQVYSTARLLNVGFTGGSIPLVWDGKEVRPASFLTAPETPALFATGTGLTGLYSYMVVLESSDAAGNLQVSVPSQPATITLANQSCQLTITIGALTPPTARVKIYRTTAAGATFYLVRTFMANVLVVGPTYVVIDSISDTGLSTFETIYDNGGELESEPAPAFTALVAHRNRLFALRPDGVIAFSQEVTDPFLPKWHAALTFRVDNSGGPPRALASMDDKLIVFQEQTISGITGQGPDATGTGGFSLPEPVAAGAGVSKNNVQSVVSTPNGVMFRDSTGIKMLARNLQVSDVGLPVQRTLGAANVSAARYFPSRHQVWFFLDPLTYVDQDTGVAGDPPVLVFDVRYNRWSTFSGPWDDLQDGVEVGGVVYLLSFAALSAGKLYRLGSAVDIPVKGQPGTEYSVVLKTAWFRGAGRNGTQRLWKLGIHGEQMRGFAHGTIQVDVYTQKSREQAKDSEVRDARYTFDATNFGALPTGGYSLHMRVTSPRCSAFRCDVTILPVGDGNGILDVRLNAISYSYGTDGKTGKAPIGRKPTAS